MLKNKPKPEIEKAEQRATMINVIKALSTVKDSTKTMIRNIAKGYSEVEIVTKFNQSGKDFFVLLNRLTVESGREDLGVKGYEKLFNHAISIRKDWPIDKFTLMILQFAPQIYNEDEQFFLSVEIPDQSVRINNEFGIIKTEAFKELWLTTSASNKEALKKACLLLVTFAHAYFVKMINNNV